MQLTVISNSPGPNQSQFFSALAARPGVDATVLYCAKSFPKWHGTEPKQLGYRAEFMYNLNPWPRSREYLHCNPRVVEAVARSKGLVFIHGYSYLSALMALWSCAVLDRPYAFWGEMIDRSQTVLPIKRSVVWPVLRRADAVLTMGRRGIASYLAIGVPRSRVHEVPYSCNLDSYLEVSDTLRLCPNRRRKVVVMAQLIPRKRVDIAINAFLSAARDQSDWDLVICGDGPCRGDLQNAVPRSMGERVAFVGFVPKDQQPRIYADADVFLLTSAEDGWGMVVPEAMAAGLPVVSTTAVESAAMLLQDGEAGFLTGPNEAELVATSLKALMQDAALRSRMGKAGRRKAASQDATKVAETCAAVLERAWSSRASHKNGSAIIT